MKARKYGKMKAAEDSFGKAITVGGEGPKPLAPGQFKLRKYSRKLGGGPLKEGMFKR